MSVVDKSLTAAEAPPRSRYSAGVMEYRNMGYWQPDYEPKDTDLIAVFRVTPQDGVDPIEGFGGDRRQIVDRDLDRGLDRPAHGLRKIPGEMLSRRSGAECAGRLLRLHRL